VALSQHDEAADEGQRHRSENAQLAHRILTLDSAALDDLAQFRGQDENTTNAGDEGDEDGVQRFGRA
jgi:hypothetical protein